jgi:hypothetical protein
VFNGIFDFLKYLLKNGRRNQRTNKNYCPATVICQKTRKKKRPDSDYIKQIMALPQFKTRREASNHLIELGFPVLLSK